MNIEINGIELDGMLVACDGSCLKNPDGPTGWAWAAADGSSAYGGMAEGTNNIGELLAVVNVLCDFPETPVLIQIDSQYAMKAATEWLPGWKRKGWMTAGGKPVKNVEIIKQIDVLMQDRIDRGFPIGFQWVKGHRTDNAFPLNTRADELAGLASRAGARGDFEIYRTSPDVTLAAPASTLGTAVDNAALNGVLVADPDAGDLEDF